MALDKSGRANSRPERGVGNIYERLDQARRQREQALDTPVPANIDRKAPMQTQRPFPILKPPADDTPTVAEPSRMEWMLPIAIGLVILAVIVGFAIR